MRLADYSSARRLALELGMSDGSLVGKWLDGRVKTIKSRQHLARLPLLLGTPADYFEEHVTGTDRLRELAEQVEALQLEQERTVRSLRRVQARLRRLEAGAVPAAAESTRRTDRSGA